MEMDRYEHGVPSWVDVSSPDVDRAVAFYSALFGWDVDEGSPDTGGYRIAMLGGRTVCGIAPLMNPGPPAWTTYVNVDSADGIAKLVKDNGGMVFMEPMDVLDIGRWALLSDPTGAAFSLWQAGKFAGFGVVEEPNTFAWIDLATRDRAAALKFYRDVFGWEVTDDPAYPQVGLDGKQFGGVMDMGDMFPDEMPAHWNPFFLVTDVDAVADKAKQLGGGVLHGPEDTPMEHGPRIAVLHDGQSAPFGIFSTQRKS